LNKCPSTKELIEGLLNKNKRSLSKIITMVENQQEDEAIWQAIFPYTGQAYVVGITGPPGAGKSSLLNHLIAYLREQNITVGVIAVDPTSPISGGALLGDRLRMIEHALDKGVFVRSMASRGCHGGLALTTRQIIRLLDCFGYEIIFIETTGVGQNEVSVAYTVDTVALVLNPDSGDEIQALKSGITEVADVFVINKSDLSGVLHIKRDIEYALSFIHADAYKPSLVLTRTAGKEEGIDKLWDEILKHKNYMEQTGELNKRRSMQLKMEIFSLVKNRLEKHFENCYKKNKEVNEIINLSEQKIIDPHTASEKIFNTLNL